MLDDKELEDVLGEDFAVGDDDTGDDDPTPGETDDSTDDEPEAPPEPTPEERHKALGVRLEKMEKENNA